MFTEEDEKKLLENFDDCNIKDLSTRLKKNQEEVALKCAELGLDRQEPKIGDIIKGWKIIDIYRVDNIRYAKIISVVDGIDRTLDFLLTRLKARKIGWPDRRRTDVSEKNFKHGLTNHTLYSTFKGMHSRCYNKNQKAFKNYGARGIKICEKWNDFHNFYNWCIENGWEEGLTIDRKDVDKDYCPDNCKFSTYKEQSDNRRVSLTLTAFGETKNASDWALDKRCNASYASICYRVNNGWDHEKAISTPSPSYSRKENMKKHKEFYYFVLDKYPEVVDEFLENNY